MRVFINYRREDAAAYARLIFDRLIAQFGRENVFLDVAVLQPGAEWLEAMKQGVDRSVFLALIGPRWTPSMTRRAQARFETPAEDYVRLELEHALSRGSGVRVIPVLIGEAVMPRPDQLPRSVRRLRNFQAVQLTEAGFDDDMEKLITAIELAPSTTGSAHDEDMSGNDVRSARHLMPPLPERAAARADERHYEMVARYMVDQGTVVPLLGSRVCGGLPDAHEIALDLAERFALEPEHLDLPRVAQQVAVTSGRPDLLRTLKQILAHEPEPAAVHRFLAHLPGDLEALEMPPRFQMILTTNYDAKLERAFEEENEPYDLAVYVVGEDGQSRFVHFPFDGEPELIEVPNRYGKFPIDDYGELQRTLIVKIHGGLGAIPIQGWRESFVITEDQYIDYLSSCPIESLVPVQVLAKLTESHCLFLGYAMRDWNLRVFLKRVWKGQGLGSRSWAVEQESDMLEKDFWSQAQVELFSVPLEEYVKELRRHIRTRRETWDRL